MEDLTKWLYQFVCEKRMMRIYADPGYREVSHIVDLQTERIIEHLDETEKKELNRLMDNLNALSSIENEHIFRATLELARELGRVGV